MGKILVCGGAGYIGSHVNKMLNCQGYQTVVFDNLVNGHKESVKWGQLIVGDLANIQELRDVFANNNIDTVVHLAAYAYVGESVKNPEKYYYNNVANTLNLLHVMMEYKVNKIVFSSTCATYGETDIVPITEETAQRPINPYGASKLMIERIFKDYSVAYGLKFVVLRYFNAAGADPKGDIGESHNPETHLIPLVLDVAGGQKRNIMIFGDDYDTEDGSCVRDYIHVSDLAKAHLLAIQYLERGGKPDFFNLGNENGTSVLEVIESARRVTGKNIEATIDKRREGDPALLVGSSKKAKAILGWEPEFDCIDTIIEHAWKWHENKEY